MTDVAPKTATFKQFARLLGERSPSYVTALKQADRLVLTPDGKRVLVDASLALIRGTADPARVGVVARHADHRAATAVGPGVAAPGGSDAAAGGDDADPPPSHDPVQDSHARRRAKALADKAETDALAADRDYRLSLGELLPAEAVVAAVRSAAAVMRAAIENLPNKLAPELAALSDEGRIRVLLSDAIEHELAELSRKFGAIARQDGA